MYFKTITLLLFALAVLPGQQAQKINIGLITSASFTSDAGLPVKLSSQSQATVLIFLSPECPICRKYAGVIENIYNTYKTKNVSFYGIFPSSVGQKPGVSSFRKDYGINFPLLIDSKDKLLELTGASITPEVFVIDNTGRILYRGKVDNWYIALGKKRSVITEHYLVQALDAITEHKKVIVPYTEAVGCFINPLPKK